MLKDPKLKIKTIQELASVLKDLKKRGKKIAHCHGVFDLLHPGHIKHFLAAKNKADILVVTVTKDEYVNKGPGRPIFNQYLRAENIAAIECVDFVAVNDWPTAVETIKKLRPNFYVKGSDYQKKDDDLTGKIYEEEEAVESVGGVVHFTDEISFSSTSLINAFMAPYPEEAKEFFVKFKKQYSVKSVIQSIKNVEDLKILVVGDIIIDEYHYCVGMGKTQKDNIIATRFINSEVFAGGALAAANHLSGFCKNVTLLSVIGAANDSDYRSFIKSHLKPDIKTNFYYRKDVPTVVKRRFVDPNFLTKLFEVCYLEQATGVSHPLENQICSYLEKNLKDFDMVMVTDFGHGLMTHKITNIISKKAKFLAINVQTNSSNIGFNLITKFPRADYICIDEPELRLACHDRVSNLEKLMIKISKQLRCGNIIITRGHRGSLAYSRKEGFVEVPVFSKEVVDRIGAGDAYFSITSPCVCKNKNIGVAGFIGNAAGAIKVLIVGNRSSVEPVPLFKYITTLLK